MSAISALQRSQACSTDHGLMSQVDHKSSLSEASVAQDIYKPRHQWAVAGSRLDAEHWPICPLTGCGVGRAQTCGRGV